MNQQLLSSDKYRSQCKYIYFPLQLIDGLIVGSATEYAKAVHAFVHSKSPGVDFNGRRLIGLAHSAGSTAM